MGRLSELIVKITANSDDFRKQLRDVNAELLRSQSTIQRQTQGFANLGSGLQSFGGALVAGVTLPLAGVAAAAVKTFGEIDSLKRALFTIEGTAAGTEARFNKLAKAAELPGLGLEQAVRADVRLRAIGLSADLSEKAILGFGKALAGAGSGAADLDETIRQFGQLASATNLTAENLKPIIERVPQAGKLLREAFGTANAEELRKLGVTSQQVVDLLITKLNQLPDVSSGIKNSLENLAQSSRLALAEVGKAIEGPTTQLIGFASSVVSKIPEVVRAFASLPQPVQTATLALAGFAGVGGVGIYTIGTVLGSFSQIVTGIGAIRTTLGALAASEIVAATAAMFTFQGAVTASSIAMGTLTVALNAVPWVAAAAGVGILIKAYVELLQVQGQVRTLEDQQAALQQKVEDRLRANGFAVDALKQALKEGNITQAEYNQGIREMAVALGNSEKQASAKSATVAKLATATSTAAKATQELVNGTGLLARVTEQSRILIEAQQILLGEQSKRIREAAEAWLVYRDFLNGVIPAAQAASQSLAELAQQAGISLTLPQIQSPIEQQSAGQIEAIKRTQAEQDSAYARSQRSLEEFNKKQKTTAQVGVEAMKQIRRATREVSDGIADAIFNGKNFGETMSRIAKSIGQNLTSFVLQKLIEATGLLKGFDRILSGVIKNVAGSAAGGVAGAAGSAAGSAAGGAASAGSSAASSAASGLAGTVTAVAGVASAISGIFGNFQAAAQNKSLDLIVKHTLQTANDLANLRRDEFVRKDEYFTKLDDLFQFTWRKFDDLTVAVRNIGTVGNVAAAGAGVNVTVNGGIIFGQNAISQLADALLAEFRIRGVLAR